MIEPLPEPDNSPSNTPMQRALWLARQAVGTTSPNPAVGAVLVKNGAIVGEGYTLPPGQRHAEIGALEQAGPEARGATLYCTLEPCCNYGRTPPCTDALIQAGVREVRIGAIDPNPTVAGRGRHQLEAAGIRVVQEDVPETRELYEGFSKHINTGLPFVTVKFAMSLDGKIATRTGHSKWVTGGPARSLVQKMRRESDAVMVGINTLLADDPQLTCRDDDGLPLERQPLRVVLDSQGRTPVTAKMLTEPGKTLLVTTEGANYPWLPSFEGGEVEVLRVSSDEQGKVDMPQALAALGQMGIVNLLVEGGSIVLGSLFDLGFVDKVHAFVAPKIIGGKEAPAPVGGMGAATMDECWYLENSSWRQIGEDWLLVGYPRRRA